MLVCLTGGIVGIALALASRRASPGGAMVVSGTSIVVAFVVSSVIGIVFGLLPARNAARLDPVDALAQG